MDVDLDAMKGKPVERGNVLSGDLMPLLVRDEEGGPSKISTVNTTSGKVAELPPLPNADRLAETYLVATESFVLVNSLACSSKSSTDEERMNWSCSGGESPHPEILVFDRAAGVWYQKVLPEDPYWQTAIGPVEPTRAMFGEIQPAGTGPETPEVPVLALALVPDLPVVPGFAPASGARCSQSQAPTLTFDRSANPSIAARTPAKGGGPQTFAVPPAESARLREIVPSIVDCYSASTFLAVPGSRTAGDEEIDDPTERGAEKIQDPTKRPPDVEIIGPTTTSTAPPSNDSDPSLTIIDLSRPDAPTTKAGDSGSLRDFVAGDKYWAFSDESGLHVHDVVSGKDRLITISRDDMIHGLPTGIALSATDDSGNLERISLLVTS